MVAGASAAVSEMGELAATKPNPAPKRNFLRLIDILFVVIFGDYYFLELRS